MKKTFLFLLLLSCFVVEAQEPSRLKTGSFKSHNDFEDNDPSSDEVPAFTQVVRLNKIDKQYSDTLYRLTDRSKNPFSVYDGTTLYIRIEDTLYRKMHFIGRFPFVTVTTMVHLQGRWVHVNKTPIWQDEHDEVQSFVYFIDKKGDWTVIGFESIRELLKGNHDLIVDFDKEKWNNDVFMKYLYKMNARYKIK